MTIEEFDRRIKECTEKIVAKLKEAKEEYERETIALAEQAQKANIPGHLALASLVNSSKMIELALGGDK